MSAHIYYSIIRMTWHICRTVNNGSY